MSNLLPAGSLAVSGRLSSIRRHCYSFVINFCHKQEKPFVKPRDPIMKFSVNPSVLIAAALVAVSPAAFAQAPAATQAQPPAEWIAYAEKAGTDIAGWLKGEDEVTTRVRAYVHQAGGNLVVKLWIDETGQITRIDFTPYADAKINADIRSLIEGRRLAPPPAGIKLPIRLALNPEAA